MLLGVSDVWWFITSLGCTVPRCTPYTLVLGAVFEVKEGTRVLTYSPDAIHYRRQPRRYRPRYQCARVLQARLVSVISTGGACHPLLFVSDTPGDPGSQLPYQGFSPYYLAPI